MMVRERQGCKVGWAVYDNEAEANERAAKERAQAQRMWTQGYDFGYCLPGEIRKLDPGPSPEWEVTTT